MNPKKANDIMVAINERLPKNQRRRNPLPTTIEERTPSGYEFGHTGLGTPSMAEGQPGQDITIKVYSKPSLRERVTRIPNNPEGQTTKVLGAIAELGYSYDPSGVSHHSYEPRLEQAGPDRPATVNYDANIGKVVTAVHFTDHNPQQ